MARPMIWAAAAGLSMAAALAGCQKNATQETSSASAESAAPAVAEVQPKLTPGVVNAVSGTTLTIMSQGAPASFQLTPGTVIMIAHKGGLADIKAGSFLGTTNAASPDGTGQSTEVHVFPPGVKMGEGDRPMGPAPAGGAASRMTNGTVSAAGPASGSRMTNGAAGNVSTGAQGVQMDVAYQGGTRHIVVPPNTPVMVMSSGTPAMLKPGSNVLVGHVAGAGGSETATFINLQP